jgi:hypothetical protein
VPAPALSCVAAGTSGRPPLPRGPGSAAGRLPRRFKSPKCIRNPFITGGGEEHEHAFDSKRMPRAIDMPYSRLQ